MPFWSLICQHYWPPPTLMFHPCRGWCCSTQACSASADFSVSPLLIATSCSFIWVPKALLVSPMGMSRWWRQPSFWQQPVLRGRFFWVKVVTLWSSRWDIFCFSWTYHRKSPPRMTVEPFHLWRFLVLSCLEYIPNLQEVLATDPEPCYVDQNLPFCFCLSSSSLSTRSFLSGKWDFWPSLEWGTFVLSFLFIRSSAGKYPLESGVGQYARSARYD